MVQELDLSLRIRSKGSMYIERCFYALVKPFWVSDVKTTMLTEPPKLVIDIASPPATTTSKLDRRNADEDDCCQHSECAPLSYKQFCGKIQDKDDKQHCDDPIYSSSWRVVTLC